MKRGRRAAVILAAVGLAGASLLAQEPARPEVLKPFRLGEEKTAPRAVPAPPRTTPRPATPAPAATPKPATPKPTTTRPQAVAPPRPIKPPEPADPGEIRMSPSNVPRTADELQLEVADNYYAKGLFEMAAPEYERYLGRAAADDGTLPPRRILSQGGLLQRREERL
jgi:hypothetical protein